MILLKYYENKNFYLHLKKAARWDFVLIISYYNLKLASRNRQTTEKKLKLFKMIDKLYYAECYSL